MSFWYSLCMAEKLLAIPKARMSPEERHLRSQLAQMVSRVGLVHATLNWREKTCGKPNCRCRSGQRHRSLYLVVSENGKVRQLFVPRSLHTQAIEWVEGHRRVRELLDELSELYWEKLRQREG